MPKIECSMAIICSYLWGVFFWNVFVRESQVGLTYLFVEFGNFFYYLITDYISSVHSFSLNYPFFCSL